MIAAPIATGPINGTSGADTLIGTFDADTIYGGGGNDTIYGSGGDDQIYGDADDDHLYGDAGPIRSPVVKVSTRSTAAAGTIPMFWMLWTEPTLSSKQRTEVRIRSNLR